MKQYQIGLRAALRHPHSGKGSHASIVSFDADQNAADEK